MLLLAKNWGIKTKTIFCLL